MDRFAATNNTDTAGLFITFEGLDGVGKSTQVRYMEKALTMQGRHVICLREPGGTDLGESIRSILLDPASAICPRAELLLFEAARAQLTHDVIVPSLEKGCVVLCDRFFDSTGAYQGFGRALGMDTVGRANELACGALQPDRTILLDLDPTCAIDRATREGADRMEGEEDLFRRHIREGFLRLSRQEPDRIRIVDASGSRLDVWRRIRDCVADLVSLPDKPPENTDETS